MKTNYTPGPWRAVDCRHQKNGQIRIFGPLQWIGNVLASGTNAAQDARLIAAAPELLAALKQFIISVEFHSEQETKYATAYASAKTTIAKATGEKEEGK